MFSLSDEQKRTLLDLARRVVEQTARDRGRRPSIPCEDESLSTLGAAFVTLHKHGQLRGCIGQVEATMPLWNSVVDMAFSASQNDPRFPSVSESELSDLDYEISVLTPMEEVEDVETIEVGRHGLLIERGYHRGLLLPQVATEQTMGSGHLPATYLHQGRASSRRLEQPESEAVLLRGDCLRGGGCLRKWSRKPDCRVISPGRFQTPP